MESKVMPSRDILDDGDYLYSVMPFCDGGEFFDYLFNEDDGNAMIIGENEARRYFLQILEVSKVLGYAIIFIL